MKILFFSLASALAISLQISAEASRGLPADLESLDQLWQTYNAACKQGEQRACQLKEKYREIIKQNFPNAVPAACPPNVKRVWFESGRQGMASGCQMF